MTGESYSSTDSVSGPPTHDQQYDIVSPTTSFGNMPPKSQPGPITDEEGYSDDDEQPDKNPLLLQYLNSPPDLPETVKNQRVAITGSFRLFANRAILEQEIRRKGGIPVSAVTRSTNVLLAPQRHPRSSKAQLARSFGIPILEEASFSQMPGTTSNW